MNRAEWRLLILLVFLFMSLEVYYGSVNGYVIVPEDPQEELCLGIAQTLNLSQNETMMFLDMMTNKTKIVMLNTTRINNTIILNNTTNHTIIITKHFNKTVIENYTTSAQLDPLIPKSIAELKADVEILKVEISKEPSEKPKDEFEELLKKLKRYELIKDAGYAVGSDGNPIPKDVIPKPPLPKSADVSVSDKIKSELATLEANRRQKDKDKKSNEFPYITAMFVLIVLLMAFSGYFVHKAQRQKKISESVTLAKSYGIDNPFAKLNEEEDVNDNSSGTVLPKTGQVQQDKGSLSRVARGRIKEGNK